MLRLAHPEQKVDYPFFELVKRVQQVIDHASHYSIEVKFRIVLVYNLHVLFAGSADQLRKHLKRRDHQRNQSPVLVALEHIRVHILTH
jgi:hypothetical protein